MWAVAHLEKEEAAQNRVQFSEKESEIWHMHLVSLIHHMFLTAEWKQIQRGDDWPPQLPVFYGMYYRSIISSSKRHRFSTRNII